MLVHDIQFALGHALHSSGALVSRACPVCGLDDSSFAFRAPLLDFHRCAGCALVYAPRHPDEDVVDRLYRRAELGRRMRDLLDEEAAAQASRPVHASLIESMLAAVSRAGAVLEIGCGTGKLLAELRPRFSRAVGVELRSGMAARARRRFGLDVHDQRLERLALAPAAFDLIVLDCVLEHLVDPRELLAQARRLLAPGGTIFVRVPSGASATLGLLRGSHPTVATHVHLNLFGPNAMRHLAWRAGLQLRRLWSDDQWDVSALDVAAWALGRRRGFAQLEGHPMFGPPSALIGAAVSMACGRTSALSRKGAGAHLCVLLDAP